MPSAPVRDALLPMSASSPMLLAASSGGGAECA